MEYVQGQVLNSPARIQDDGRFAASTKQVNQFFRRFNGEESPDTGNRLNPGDADYRDRALRSKYLGILFDEDNKDLDRELRRSFSQDVLSESLPYYLNFHREGWFAEVEVQVNFRGKRETCTLFMKLQAEGLGYEWVIDKVSFNGFKGIFDKPQGENKSFLHPLSHELGFMNLRRAFDDTPKPESFTPTDFTPDYLTLFLYELKRGNIKYESVLDVKFHFFQINGWYFELSNFNRPGFNTGWLISNLVKLNPGDKEIIQNFIYDQK